VSFVKVLWFLSDLNAALSQGFALAAGILEPQPETEEQK
jgi:hypothetical protein